jgi:hypothetical protein
MLALLVSAALAAPGSAGAVHIGASFLDPGTSWAGMGGLAVWGSGGWAATGLEAGSALGPEGRGAFSVAAGIDQYADALPLVVGVRHLLVDEERFRLAATGQALVLPVLPGGWIDGIQEGDVATWWSPGLALEAGSERVYWDLSVPVWGITTFNQYVGFARTPFPLAATTGLNVEIGEHHRLRVGLPELLSWSIRTGDVYFDVGGFTIGPAGVVWTKLGAVF